MFWLSVFTLLLTAVLAADAVARMLHLGTG
jgi:hypothetical protein